MEIPARCLNKAEQIRMSTEKCERAQDTLHLEHTFLRLSNVLILSMICEAICTITPAPTARRPIQVARKGDIKGTHFSCTFFFLNP